MNKLAILLYCDSFETFFKLELGIDELTYLEGYRNDFSWYFCSGLREVGVEPIIYIFSRNQQFSGIHETHDGFKVRFIPLKYWYTFLLRRISGLLWHFRTPSSPIAPAIKYIQELTNILAGIDALKRSLQEDKVDVLYVQEYWTTRFDFLVDKLELPIIGADQGAKSIHSISRLKQKSFPKAHILTCLTTEELEKVENYGANAVYFPNPVDTEYFSPSDFPKKNGSKKTLLTVVRLNNKQKRVSDLIRSLLYLDHTWVLNIVGAGVDIQMLKDIVAELSLDDRVNFLGFMVVPDERREEYRTCDVYAMPSASEGLPLAALEAMSCGAPIVSSDIDAFKRIVQNDVNGLRVPVGNPRAIAAAVLKCYDNRQRYGLASRKIVLEAHSKKTFFTHLAQIVNDAVPLNG